MAGKFNYITVEIVIINEIIVIINIKELYRSFLDILFKDLLNIKRKRANKKYTINNTIIE